jgi:hypothetical protein
VTTPPASRTWSKQIAAIKITRQKKTLEKSDQHLPGGREGVAEPKNSGSNNSNYQKNYQLRIKKPPLELQKGRPRHEGPIPLVLPRLPLLHREGQTTGQRLEQF